MAVSKIKGIYAEDFPYTGSISAGLSSVKIGTFDKTGKDVLGISIISSAYSWTTLRAVDMASNGDIWLSQYATQSVNYSVIVRVLYR